MVTRMKEFPIDKQIEFEKRIIDQMNKPLCLTPSFTVCLLSNLLLYNKSKSNSFNNLKIIPYLKSHSNFSHFPSFSDDQNCIQNNNKENDINNIINININIKQEMKIEEEEEERSDTSKLENLFFTLPSYITSSSLSSSSLSSSSLLSSSNQNDNHNNNISRHPIKTRDQNRANELIGYLTHKQQIIPGQNFQLSSQYSPTNHYTPSPTSSPSSFSVVSPPSIPIKINHYDPSSSIELKDRTITFQRIYNTRSKITLEIKKAINGGYSAIISSSSSSSSSSNLTTTINTLDHPPIRFSLPPSSSLYLFKLLNLFISSILFLLTKTNKKEWY